MTRGRYGYTDPAGRRREYRYTAGSPCTGEQQQQEEEERAGRGLSDGGYYSYREGRFIMDNGRSDNNIQHCTDLAC